MSQDITDPTPAPDDEGEAAEDAPHFVLEVHDSVLGAGSDFDD